MIYWCYLCLSARLVNDGLAFRLWGHYITPLQAYEGCTFPARRHYETLAIMKKDIHPEYKEVVFQDISTDFSFLTRSTIRSKDTITWEDGKEYPLVKVEISSQSHPFYTGKQKIVDTAGRVDRFRRKYGLS